MKRDDRRVHRHVHPSLEALEDRSVPAGNVAAGIVGGSLIVIGDGQANDIKISAAYGAITISAGGTTTVNGAKSVSLYGFKGHANIQMGGGNDFLTVGPMVVPGVLKVDMGAGDDALSVVSSSIGKGLDIAGGDGNDFLMVGSSTIKGNSTVNAGGGDNHTNILGSSFGSATSLLGGGGNSLLGISGSGFSGGAATKDFKQTFKAALPVALNKTVAVDKGGTSKIDVSDAVAGEGTVNKSSISITKQPQFGTATANADGTITYVNGGSGSPSDSIKYTIKNSAGALSNEGIITINVGGAGVGALNVIVSAGVSSPTKTSPIPFIAAFSDDVTGFDASDIQIAGGTIGTFTATNARTYAFTVTPSGQGTVSAQVKVSSASNGSGSQNAASNVASVVFDSVAPTVTFNALTTNSTTPTLTGTVGESTAKVAVTVNNTTLNAVVNGTNWSAAVSPALAAGTYSITATATDLAGNSSSTTNATGLVVDQTPPTTTISSSSNNPTNLSSIPITITFNKAVTEFVTGDITVTGGTLSNFSGSGTTYTATVTPTADGTVTVAVAAGVAKDAAGNTNAAATSLTRLVDRTAPTVRSQLANISKSAGAANTNIILAGTFDDANIGQSTVTFHATKGTTPIDLRLTLLDKDAPLTVANFFNYFDRYEQNGGTIFHRKHIEAALKVLQGGGFTFNDATNTISGHIVTDDPIKNEFSSSHPNARGTLAMAKVGGDPNSATSEWFFNLDDVNINTLGAGNNGGFTVFGQVNPADLAKMDDLASPPITSAQGFTELPVVDGSTVDENNILRVVDFEVTSRDGQLTYSNVSSSNPAVVAASLGGFQGNLLSLDYLAAGTSTVSFTVTDKAGNASTMSFTVTVT